MSFSVREVQAFSGKQIVIWLNDSEGNPGPNENSNYCVTLSIAEAPQFLTDTTAAYAQCMQEALIDVAAGGCRKCRNERRIYDSPFGALVGGSWVPCDVCIPRAEERIRKSVMLRRRRTRG